MLINITREWVRKQHARGFINCSLIPLSFNSTSSSAPFHIFPMTVTIMITSMADMLISYG